MAVFKFKQFSITQDRSPMKVGTDAMMLGALIGKVSKQQSPTAILDIGTGNGVIALMLAQQFCQAKIIGIDCYSPAVEEAYYNFSTAPFSQQLTAIQCDFLNYHPAIKFDLIVSNPPYYQSQMLPQAPLDRLAKHEGEMTVEKLVEKSATLLTKKGELWLILPPQKAENLIHDRSHSLHLKTKIHLYGNPQHHSRTIIVFSPIQPTKVNISSFTIRASDGKYTSSYKELTQIFHANTL